MLKGTLATIQETIKEKAICWKERPALQMFSLDKPLKIYSYTDLIKKIEFATKQIIKVGINLGDRIILLSENRPEWVITYLAILSAGATPVLIDSSLPVDDLEELIQFSDSRALLVSRKLWNSLTLEMKEKMPVLDIEGDWLNFPGTPHHISSDMPPTSDPDPAIAVLLFTSGTTGRPRGVLLEHQSLLYSALGCMDAIGFQEEKQAHRVLCILPMNHIAGLICNLIAPLLMGATATFLATVDKQTILTAMQATQTTLLPGVPRLFQLFYSEIQHQIQQRGLITRLIFQILGTFCGQIRQLTPWNPGRWIFSSVHQVFGGELRVCCCGAASLPSEVERGLERLGFTILKAYGLTETGINVCNNLSQQRQGHVGQPFKGVEVRIDHTGNSSNEGEICVRGVTLMRGYFRDVEATEQVVDQQGWFHTGDLGSLDSQGNLIITDRIKDLIVTAGGKKASPLAVANYYQGITGVQELAVLGMPAMGGYGEAVHAAVVLDRNVFSSNISNQQALDIMWQEIQARSLQVPNHLRIQKIHIVEDLPKTTTLKIKLAELKKLLNSSLSGEQQSSILIQSTNQFKLLSQKIILERDALLRMSADEQTAQIEAYLLELVSHLLQIDLSISAIKESLLTLGIDSLTATELKNQLQNQLGWNISIDQFLNGASIRQLAANYPNYDKQTRKEFTLTSISREEHLPLSFAQQRLWFLDQLQSRSPLYNISGAVKLQGQLNIIALEQSFQEIIRRHEVLRTNFAAINGQPVQIIHPKRSWTMPVIDLRPLAKAERKIKSQRLAFEEAQCPFNLAEDYLLRASLLHLDETEYVLLLTMHHIVGDGWSISVLSQELTVIYNSFRYGKPSPLPKLSIQYADFAVWQRQWLQGKVLESQLAYWQQQLADVPTLLSLPTDRPRPAVQTFRGAVESCQLSEVLTEKLKLLSRQEGVTLFMTLLTAFNVLLYRYTQQTDIVVGSPVFNRDHKEIEGLIGFFVNTLVLRTDVSGNPSFQDLLQRVRKVALAAYTYQDLPFEMLVEALQPQRNLSHTPLFQVMFVLQNTPMQKLELADVNSSIWTVENLTAKFDLTLSIEENSQGLIGVWEHNTDLFDASTIQRMIGHFQTLLEEIVAHPEQSVGKLPLLTKTEQQQLLMEWNNTQADYPQDKCIHQLFEQQVEKTPDAVAVVFGEQKLTYQELNYLANQLAHYLQRLGVAPEILVGICVERSLEMLIGMLGVLKTGAAYLPLDPTYPQERLSFMLKDAQVLILLTQQHLVKDIPTHIAQIVCLDTDWDRIAQHSQENVLNEVKPENLAYVIYTSGSTGKPKGVMVKHSGLSNLAQVQIQTFAVGCGSRVLQFASFSFDASIWEVVMALVSGATLYLAKKDDLIPGSELIRLLNEYCITHITLPPSALAFLPVEKLPVLQTIIVAGEACSPVLMKKWYVGRHFFNGYGPTEATICASIAEFTEHSNQPVIGRSIANTQIYILDHYLQPVPIGVPGELHIGGVGLARGYLNRPELTAERFISNPFNHDTQARLYKTGDLARYLPGGNIEYLGRIDHQVKIRGFRIELGEIEATLSQHPNIQATVVTAREDTSGNKYLVAYLVSTQEQTPTISELRHFLCQKLPEYMIPSFFVFLEALPLTPNGKVNRCDLPEPKYHQELAGSFVAPRDTLELKLVKIWEQILKIQPVSVKDDFFELGGHSLLAVGLMNQIQQQFGQSLPLATLFQSRTIEQLASLLRQNISSSSCSPLVAIQSNVSQQPLFCVHGIGGNVLNYFDLARCLEPNRSFYGLQAKGLDGQQQPYTRIEDMAAYYIDAIRAVQPQGPYLLSGWSMGGIVAFEMAIQLQKKGHEIEQLFLLDSWTPNYIQMRSGNFNNTLLLKYFLQDLESYVGKSLTVSYDSIAPLATEEQINHVLKQAKISEIVTSDLKSPQIRPLIEVFQANLQALQNYIPQIGSTRITLFRASEILFGNLDDSTLGWSELTTQSIDVCIVPGNHYTMLTQPYVQDLSEKLKFCL